MGKKRIKDDILDDLEKAGIEITKAIEKTTNDNLEKLLKKTINENDKNKENDNSEDGEEAGDDSASDGGDDAGGSERITPEGEGIAEPEIKTEESIKGDYLQRYQYKKVSGNPVVGTVETNPDEGSKAETMKKFLLGQPRVMIMIPQESGSTTSIPLSVCLNGYRLDLPRSVYFEVPEQVATVVMESQKQQIDALKPYRIDPKSTEKALQG